MATNRETARDGVVTLLTAGLVGTGLPVKTVTGSKVTSLEGLTPLVFVRSTGTMRNQMPIAHPTFGLEVQVWVRQACTGWTSAQAADALDEIESLIAAIYEANRGTATWATLEYSAPSSVDEMDVGGTLYYREVNPTLIGLVKS